ncbi:ATP-binding protein [Croceitalea marina]|uniref:ATP-binding protein n=1 Tax=Croceitalea marina TaxID=1775166 RepID=A0ABW5MWQ9_9FLAO
MKWTLFCICVILISSCSTKNKNSNKVVLPNINDSTKIWITEAIDNSSLSNTEKYHLLSKSNVLINKYPDSYSKASALSKLSLLYNRLNDSLSFRKVNAENFQVAKRIGNSKSLGVANWDLGYFFRKNRLPDSAIYHYRKAYELFRKAELDSSSIAYPGRMLYSMAIVKDNSKDYTGAEKDIVKAITYFKEHNLKKHIYSSYNLLAVIQNGMGKYDNAIKYHKKAKEYIPFSKESQKYSQNTANLNNMASTNLRKGDYSKAIEYYQKLLYIDSFRFKKRKSYAKAISGLAYAKFKNGSKDFDQLANEYLRSNMILDNINNVSDKARNYQYYAEMLNEQGQTDLAIENALIAKKIAEESSNNDRLLSSLKLLSTLDRKNSADYSDVYFTLSENLLRKERAMQDKFARIEMETDEVIEENESLAKQKETLIGLGIALLLLGFGTFVIIIQRSNNQRLKFQQTQQESNQEIYNLMLSQQGKFQEGKQLEQKRISEEIHDGILGQMLGVRLILSGLNERNDESAIQQRGELIEKLRELEEEMRTISHELNNAAYKKINNFIVAIQDLITTARSSSKIEILFDFTESYDWDRLDGDIKINTYRIIQECIQNCIKHSRCTKINISLNTKGNEIILKIKDDGVGFNVKKGKRGIGLRNITSRIDKINSGININSGPGIGTEIKITVPLLELKTKETIVSKERKALEA